MKRNKLAVCAAAAVMILGGCGKSIDKTEKTVSESEKTVSQAEAVSSAESAESAVESESDESQAVTESAGVTEAEYQPGELLKAAAEKFSGSYTYKLKISYSDEAESESAVTQISDGSDCFYMSVKERGSSGLSADSGYLRLGDTAYDIDSNLGVYEACEIKSGLGLLDNIISMKLDRTSTHLPSEDDAEGYQIEEYTYTGDNYITVYDLYFDENGELKKYTVCYSGEGQDDLIETAEVVSFVQEADEKYLNADVLKELKDFSAMTEDERLAFCQGVCSEYGVTTDNMYALHITTDDLKRISLEDLTELIYTYGKKSETEEKGKDKDKKKAGSESEDSKADSENSTESGDSSQSDESSEG
ncbi:MAG: hypothetical protein J6M17_08695 [Ruminococcus sp.]|nr:hypothetical protein [Ruminococcus sp.]